MGRVGCDAGGRSGTVRHHRACAAHEFPPAWPGDAILRQEEQTGNRASCPGTQLFGDMSVQSLQIASAAPAGPADSSRCRQMCRSSILDGPWGAACRAARSRGRASVVQATVRWRPRGTGCSRFFRPGVGTINPLRGIGDDTNRGDATAGIRSAFATFVLWRHGHPA